MSFYILYFKGCCFNTILYITYPRYLPYTYLLNGSVEYVVTTLDIFCVCEPPEDDRQTGPKHVVREVHNKT
jgi:hypothetical protein